MIPWVHSLDDLEYFAAAVTGPYSLGNQELLHFNQEIETNSHHVYGKEPFLCIPLWNPTLTIAFSTMCW